MSKNSIKGHFVRLKRSKQAKWKIVENLHAKTLCGWKEFRIFAKN